MRDARSGPRDAETFASLVIRQPKAISQMLDEDLTHLRL
jgi:hypothetical protein